jgi:lipoprotein-anchoring transpeptidase ErfK/SrfK
MVVAAGLFVTACSGESASPTTTEADRGEPPTTEPETTVPETTEPATTVPETTVAPTTAATTVPPTTLSPAPVPGQPNPACIVTVAPGDSLSLIVSRLGNPAVTADAVAAENGLANPDTINVGAQLDVCPGNGLDDVTGAPRVPPTAPPTAPAPTPPPPVAGLASGVEAQQQKLNELFSPLGMRPLTVDGVSGRMTKQLLCAARLSLGLPVTRDDMVPGSPEEQSLMASTGLQIPPGAPVHAERWGLIDQHCQVLFVGQGSGPLVFVFPTSTGQSEYPTRDQNASRVFRFNPARDNGGWHNSIDYPVGPDNPLNGNMYKPLYFDRGQAIHGANTVPTAPASHGCARLRVPDQDTLVNWLGLGDQGSQIWDNPSRINFTVTVVGRY